MKRLIAAALALTLCVPAALAAPDVPAFSDVPADAWYAPYVALCAEQGLLNGTGGGKFDPLDEMTGEEAIVMAARLRWQTQGGTGALPKGPATVEELKTALGADADKTLLAPTHHYFSAGGPSLDDKVWLADQWSWDGIAYLARQGKDAGAIPPLMSLQAYDTADRWSFYNALAFATQGMDLPILNDVKSLPDSEDAGVLRLYQAGILAGTDGYGTFLGAKGLTRAEAAAALARIADPALRLTFTLEPAPAKGYSLTHLTDGTPQYGAYNSAACVVDDTAWNLDGQKIPIPAGYSPRSPHGPSMFWGMLRYLLVYADSDNGDSGLLDGAGNMVATSGRNSSVDPTQDGHIIYSTSLPDGGLEFWLLDGTGVRMTQLTAPEGLDPNWNNFNEGLAPCQDLATRKTGYVDQTGAWVLQPQWEGGASAFSSGYAVVYYGQGCAIIDRTGKEVVPNQEAVLELFSNSPDYTGGGLFRVGEFGGTNYWLSLDGASYPEEGAQSNYENGYVIIAEEDGFHYQDLTPTQVSEGFSWCGPIDATGRGFVGRDGKVYRIQFEQ